MSDTIHKGRCMCGAVSIEAKGAPVWTATCHCADCRRATGSAMSAFAGYLTENATISGDSFSEYESSPGTQRGFCSNCGTRLTCQMESYPGEIHFHVGIFQDANFFAPMANAYVKDKLDWVQLEANLPAFHTVLSDEKD